MIGGSSLRPRDRERRVVRWLEEQERNQLGRVVSVRAVRRSGSRRLRLRSIAAGRCRSQVRFRTGVAAVWASNLVVRPRNRRRGRDTFGETALERLNSRPVFGGNASRAVLM